MTHDTRVEELLEELLERDSTPEEVCRDAPELLARVRERWQRLRNLQGEIDFLFPSPAEFRRAAAAPLADTAADLPQIPGYDVREVLGRGGVGVVYKAWHLRLNRPIALKMLLAGEYAVPQELARFSREAEVVAALRHPHIVQVYDVGDHNGRPYFTMEFVEGGNLSKKLAGTPLPAREAAALLAALAEAMHVAHIGGIVHRDLKPGNILLTADGTPKITDFGLARRLDSGSVLTLSGAAVGTPSYMAPEQAQGNTRAIGPAVDVYSLGALLYEMLTGRPPFRAETPLATQMQVITQDPVTPSRLNAEASRDLETISLKCLHKDPSRRYESAAALAEDLHRFLRDEPITARPTGAVERASKWVRRRPAQAALLAGGVLVSMGLLGLGLWKGVQRAATVRDVEERVREIVRLQQRSAWNDARARLDLAKLQLGTSGPAELVDRLDEVSRELELVAQLDDFRLVRATLAGTRFDESADDARADAAYEAALNVPEIGMLRDDPQLVAARIEASGIHGALVAALDDWALCAVEKDRRSQLLDVARRADPDPTGWRDRVRDPATWNDKAVLTELAHAARIEREPVPLLVALGKRLWLAGGDAVPFLTRLQQLHPEDLWVNFALGDALRMQKPRDAMRYYQAALSIRPEAAVTYSNLGNVLARDGQLDEALTHFERAIEIEPARAGIRTNFGNCLSLAGRYAEATVQHEAAIRLEPTFPTAYANLGQVYAAQERWIECIEQFQKAVELSPRYATAHDGLCLALATVGRVDEALEHGEEALRLDANLSTAHCNFSIALQAKGRVDEAIEHYRRAIVLEPGFALAHNNLGNSLSSKGRVDEAIAEFEKTLDADPDYALAHANLGAILASKGQTDAAIEHFRRAVRGKPDNAKYQFNLGLSLHDIGRYDEASECFQRAIELDPKLPHPHAALGRTLLMLGRFSDARGATQGCLDLLPEGHPNRGQAVELLQRIERMSALDARLPAVRAGAEQPADGAELLQFSELSRCKQEYAAAARFAAQAFAEEPSLAENVRTNSRYDAACCAALAGRATVAGANVLGDEERAQWREQAREWLRADLTAHAEQLERDPASYRGPLERVLVRWRVDPDLSGLRDDAALSGLSAAERQRCRQLWSDVELLRQQALDTE